MLSIYDAATDAWEPGVIFSWFSRRRREKILSRPMSKRWLGYLKDVPFYAELAPKERAKVRDDMRVIAAEKDWEGCGGLKVTGRMKAVISAQAALLILNLEHDYYQKVGAILVYPGSFVVPSERRGPDGIVHAGGQETLGLAAYAGPVVLSWDTVRRDLARPGDGRNVVLHEFAHKLDMLDGFADGTPPLKNLRQYNAWTRIMGREYERLAARAERGVATLLDHYGAEDPAEFFAVATECFFENPSPLRARHRELYGLMAEYYGQDPAARRGKRKR